MSVEAAAPRRLVYMPLDEITPAARNPKQHDAEGIADSISQFGFAEMPVLDERTARLVSGHGRINDLARRAAAGETPPDGVTVDEAGRWLVPVVRGWTSASDAHAEAFLLAANKLTVNGGWDDHALAQLMADLGNADSDLVAVTGFDPAELDDLMSLLEGEPDVHEQPPATGARYAETEAEMAQRDERIADYKPAVDRAGGFTEVILVYPLDERDEVGRLVDAARDVLGRDLRVAEVVLRALRVLAAVVDGRHDASPVALGSLARHAGWVDQ